MCKLLQFWRILLTANISEVGHILTESKTTNIYHEVVPIAHFDLKFIFYFSFLDAILTSKEHTYANISKSVHLQAKMEAKDA